MTIYQQVGELVRGRAIDEMMGHVLYEAMRPAYGQVMAKAGETFRLVDGQVKDQVEALR